MCKVQLCAAAARCGRYHWALRQHERKVPLGAAAAKCARYHWARWQRDAQGTAGRGGSVVRKVPLGAAAASASRYAAEQSKAVQATNAMPCK